MNLESELGISPDTIKDTFIELLKPNTSHLRLIKLLKKKNLTDSQKNTLNHLLLSLSQTEPFTFFIPIIRSIYQLRIDTQDKCIQALNDIKPLLSPEYRSVIQNIIDFIQDESTYDQEIETSDLPQPKLLTLITHLPKNKWTLVLDCCEYLNCIFEY